jgi:hypothetical protein
MLALTVPQLSGSGKPRPGLLIACMWELVKKHYQSRAVHVKDTEAVGKPRLTRTLLTAREHEVAALIA